MKINDALEVEDYAFIKSINAGMLFSKIISFFIFQVLDLESVVIFSHNNLIPLFTSLKCTSETVKRLAKMSQWRRNKTFMLKGITEAFNADDFCDFVKKGHFKELNICFAENVNQNYKNNFKQTISLMKQFWPPKIRQPEIGILG